MADAKRAPYMAKVSYNEFRKLHKGTPKKEMSELWKQYKNDEYELPVEEATTVEEQVEEPVEEPVVEEAAVEAAEEPVEEPAEAEEAPAADETKEEE